jgi:2-(1,2-epoxy-1,2-dihydrophenyl)acetyl-CoA isomerase
MSDFRTIHYVLDGSVAKLTLNQPDKLNALSPTMVNEAMKALDLAEASGARALLLAAEGRAFCSGADLTASHELDFAPEEILEKLFNPFFERLLRLPMPVVCAANGLVAGGGCTLVFNSDFAVVARSAYFLQPFTRIGILPDGGATWMLPRQVGRARAMELMLLAEKLPAEKAESWGMIYKVVDAAEVLGEATKLAERLAAGPTLAYAATREAVYRGATSDYSAALRHESDTQKVIGKTADVVEGISAFIQKRTPNFQGR